jgi:serine/threonine-protein kinase
MAEWSLDGFTELKPLGEGGFGRVVLARHNAANQLVAIKYLHDTTDPALRAQFRHEAAILRLVISPHVTHLFDYVETDAGAAIVMEAVPGVQLSDVLAREPILPPESALAVLKGSLLGLAAAHTAGTVHRDYKPANVLVQPNGQSKLVDFGIAVLTGHSGLPSGTPAYMAPEQWHGNAATPATDVYAATCVFFQCVTGHRPYAATDTEQLRQLHLTAAPPADQAPEPVRRLVRRGMAKDPVTRPASAAAFVTELEAAAYAGYGPDWETRGRQRLAAHAGALLALSPLAFLASTTAATTLTTAGGAAVAGSAAGSGLLSTVAAKVAAIVVGAAVVAGATAVVVTTVDDDTPPAATQEIPQEQQGALQVDVEARTRTFDTFTFSGQYARVSGLDDAALEQRINEQLAAPVDDWIEFMTNATGDSPAGTPPAAATVETTVRISGPKAISVDYLRVASDSSGLYFGASGTGSVKSVLLDLSTGEPLTLTDVFPIADQPDGAAELAIRIRAANPWGLCGEDGAIEDAAPLELTPESFTEPYSTSGDPLATVSFTEEGAEFAIMASAFDYPMVCDLQRSFVSYDSLTDLLSPRAEDLLR